MYVTSCAATAGPDCPLFTPHPTPFAATTPLRPFELATLLLQACTARQSTKLPPPLLQNNTSRNSSLINSLRYRVLRVQKKAIVPGTSQAAASIATNTIASVLKPVPRRSHPSIANASRAQTTSWKLLDHELAPAAIDTNLNDHGESVTDAAPPSRRICSQMRSTR